MNSKSKKASSPDETKAIIGTYEINDPYLWGMKVSFEPNFRFNYYYFDDLSHINTEGTWRYEKPYVIVRTDEQLANYVQVAERNDPNLNPGQILFTVLDENGKPTFAEFNINAGEQYAQTSEEGVIKVKVDKLNYYFISKSARDFYGGPYYLKNEKANQITLRFVKLYDERMHKIFSDEKWLLEDGKLFYHKRNGEVDKAIFLKKTAQ